jgi:hypothetical protein
MLVKPLDDSLKLSFFAWTPRKLSKYYSAKSLVTQPGEHFDSARRPSVAIYDLNKAAHYNGKTKRKSKVGRTLDFKGDTQIILR